MVWLAQDRLLARQVAVKEFVPPVGADPADQETLRVRTLREARTAARLSHPNVVTIYDVVEDGSRPWIVMELIAARSLRDIVHEHGTLAPRQAAIAGLRARRPGRSSACPRARCLAAAARACWLPQVSRPDRFFARRAR